MQDNYRTSSSNSNNSISQDRIGLLRHKAASAGPLESHAKRQHVDASTSASTSHTARPSASRGQHKRLRQEVSDLQEANKVHGVLHTLTNAVKPLLRKRRQLAAPEGKENEGAA